MKKYYSDFLADDNIESLKKQNQLLLTILDHISEGIYAVDKNGTIILYSKVVEEIEGNLRQDMLGENEREFYFMDDIPYYDKFTKRVEQTKNPIKDEIAHYKMANGSIQTIIINLFPFFYQGNLEGIFSIGQDRITLNQTYEHAKKTQRQLLSANAQSKYEESNRLEDIIGISRNIKDVIKLAKRIAARDSSIMLLGETGTGKELFAQGVHNAGQNPQGPFVPVNCAAIPETLLESILLGTTRGAFTGAIDMPGLFEQAESGTIFLDEINSMPLAFQAKLLRVIQEKKVRRIGSKKEISINCRIISASNTDLLQSDSFRSDLFFRLAVVTIKIPPLRERKEDILVLSNYFIGRFNERFQTSINKIDEELQRILFIYSWPGNVRELENIIESAMNFVDDRETVLNYDHIPEYFKDKLLHTRSFNPVTNTPQISLKAAVDNFEKKMIIDTLEANHWNLSATARQLEIQRQSLQFKIKKYNLIKP